MKLTIEIPQPYAPLFENDRFQGILERMYKDIAGRYSNSTILDIEVYEVLMDAIKNAEVVEVPKNVHMTNREQIANMSVVDFFKEYVYYDEYTFTEFIAEAMDCDDCPACVLEEPCLCVKNIDKWLDQEVSE